MIAKKSICVFAIVILFIFDLFILASCNRQLNRRRHKHHSKHQSNTIILRQKPDEQTTPNPFGKIDMSYDDIYSEWTPWSRCRKRCKQVRTRVCIAQEYCSSTILKEERNCTGGRCKKIPEIQSHQNIHQENGHKGKAQFRVLYHLQGFVYSQWSEWSPCTKSCRTRRYRACEMTSVCGNSVIQEDAICYIKGSQCEQLYNQKKEAQYDDLTDLDLGIYDNIDNMNCGVPSVDNIASNLRIIGGRESSKGSWPWMVAILNKHHEPFCGGTLITPQFVLTAAHCVRRRLFIRAGEHDLVFTEGSEQQIRVSDIFIHPDYDVETVDNDIALLRLRSPLKMNKFVSPACLPSPNDSLPVDSLGTILGWGKRKNSEVFGTDVLHQAEVPVADISDCKKVYENYFISNNMICAGYKRGKVDSCAGDSGGPLLVNRDGRWFIHGITSFGEGCGRKGRYGIYAKVPSFVNWIKETIQSNTNVF